MNDAVAGFDVSRDDCGVIYLHYAIGNRKGHRAALHGIRRHAIAEVGGHHLTRHHMVEQDLRQLSFWVGKQCFDRAGRQRSEGFIGGRKDRERPFSLQRVHQPGRFDCGNEGIKAAGAYSGVNDVGHLGHSCCRRLDGCLGRGFRCRFRRSGRRGSGWRTSCGQEHNH